MLLTDKKTSTFFYGHLLCVLYTSSTQCVGNGTGVVTEFMNFDEKRLRFKISI